MSQDRDMVRTFETDEAKAMETVEEGLGDWLNLKFYNYGSVYFYVTILFLLPFKLTGALNDQTVIIALRGVCLLFGVLTISAVYLIGRRFFDSFTAVLSAFLLSTVPPFVYWSSVSHPETIQLFLICACLYFCLRMVEEKKTTLKYPSCNALFKRGVGFVKDFLVHRRNLVLSSILAGLTFGAKYVGVLLIPTIFFVHFITQKRQKISPSLFIDSVIILLVFGLAFAVSNPYSIIYWRSFGSALIYESNHVAFGDGMKADANGWLWLDVIKNQITGPVIFYLSVVSLLFSCARVCYRFYKGVLTADDLRLSILCFWVLSLFAYVFFRINMREARFILPLVPALLLILSFNVSKIWKLLYALPIGIKIFVTVMGIFYLMIAVNPNLNAILTVKNQILTRQADLSINAGLWMSKNIPANSAVLYYPYMYIPPSFSNKTARWELAADVVSELKPDIIVFTDGAVNRYNQISEAEKYGGGKARYLEINKYHASLLSGKNPGYTLVKSFNDVIWVFGRRNATISP
jgi:4-amino-4-deoxy-L-arabinose transferase-like glycosyltransferase